MKRKKEIEGKKISPKKVKIDENVMVDLENQSKKAIKQVLDKKKKKENEQQEEDDVFKSISEDEDEIFEDVDTNNSEIMEEEELIIDMEATEKKPKKRKGSSAPRRTKLDEFITVNVYKLFLIKKLKKMVNLHQQMENEEIRGILFSILPKELHFMSDSKKDLKKIHSWMFEHFELKNDKQTDQQSIGTLKNGIIENKLNEYQYLYVFLILCRIFNFISRIIFTVDFDSKLILFENIKLKKCWIDVYSTKENDWIPFDSFQKFKQPEKIKHEYPVFSIAISKQDYVSDVTLKYLNVQQAKKAVFIQNRFSEISLFLTRYLKENYQILADPDYENVLNEENEEIQNQILSDSQEMPKTLNDFKNHPVRYFLEKNLGKYQAIYPEDTKPVDYFGKDKIAVFLKTNVVDLHQKDIWPKYGRIVKKNEKSYKVVKASGMSSKMCSELFGEWQTEMGIRPIAKDGIVPKNERGQVDLWADCLIPVGVVHLEHPRMSLVAKKLGIDYAPAMLGFEVRKRHSIPNIRGIVVCEEFKDTLIDAYEEAESSKTICDLTFFRTN
eukprot:gene3508-6156_t